MPVIAPDTAVSALKTIDGARTEIFKITLSTADDSVKEVQTITVPSTASATQGDYFIVTDIAARDEAFWLDIDANGTAPAQAGFTGTTAQNEVDIVGGGTAAQNAALVKTSLDASGLAITTVDNEDGTLTITMDNIGNATAPSRSNAAEDGNGSFTVATTTAGVASSLQNDYITFGSHFVWANVNSDGSDPAPGGTAIACAISIGDSVATQHATMATAINDVSGLTAEVHDANSVMVFVDATGSYTDPSASNWSGASVEVITQGTADLGYQDAPSDSATGLTGPG